MRLVLFGDPLLAPRTQRACGGAWVDLDSAKLDPVDTVFLQAGALMRAIPRWETREPLFGVGATLEDEQWQRYFKYPRTALPSRPRSFFLSGPAIAELSSLRKKYLFWDALQRLDLCPWVEPQLRNWFHGNLRVLQVITSLQVGGAERVCVALGRMSECVGIVAWGRAGRTSIREPNWDLSKYQPQEKLTQLLTIARELHVDLIHAHLLTADESSFIAARFPLLTTIHNTKEGWPPGYSSIRPGFLVGCSKAAKRELGPAAQVAWNGVEMKVTRKPRRNSAREIRLVTVANFRPQKRLHRLPAIVRELCRRGYSPTLTVVSTPHPRDKRSHGAQAQFWRVVRSLRLEGRVFEVSTTDVRPVLAKSDVFISASHYEGLSLSHLEALAAGLPVVTTTVGGSTEIGAAIDGPGYLILPLESRAPTFAKAVLQVKDLPRKNRLPDQFTERAMQARYRWLYRCALSNGALSSEIWLVTNNFSVGGAQSSARRLLTAMQPRTTVRAFTLQEPQPSRGTQTLMDQGIAVRNLAGRDAIERASELLRIAAFVRPRAILLWNVMSADKCAIADGLRVPVVDVSPGAMFFESFERYLKMPRPELPVQSSQDYGELLAGAVTKFSREQERMTMFLDRRVAVIPNGVTGIEPVQRDFKRARVFGTAARIAPHKRIEDLLEAFQGIDATLLIAGPVEPGAEQYAAELRRSAPRTVRWLDTQPMARFLPRLDVFVMISEPPGCPNASLEAMHSGLPLMITDVGGANEQVIHGKNGWLLPPRDPGAMRNAIEEACILHPRQLQRMSRASLTRAKNFSMNKMVRRYEQVITEAVDRFP